jgi:hypothetical protein
MADMVIVLECYTFVGIRVYSTCVFDRSFYLNIMVLKQTSSLTPFVVLRRRYLVPLSTSLDLYPVLDVLRIASGPVTRPRVVSWLINWARRDPFSIVTTCSFGAPFGTSGSLLDLVYEWYHPQFVHFVAIDSEVVASQVGICSARRCVLTFSACALCTDPSRNRPTRSFDRSCGPTVLACVHRVLYGVIWVPYDAAICGRLLLGSFGALASSRAVSSLSPPLTCVTNFLSAPHERHALG